MTPPHRPARGWIGKVLLLLLLALAAAAAFAWLDYQRFARTPLPLPEDGLVLEVPRGQSLRGIVAQLAGQGLTPAWRRHWWQALAVEEGVLRRLQAGEYRLEPGLDPRGLLDQLARGRVIQYRFTLVEGWTFAELRRALAAQEAVQATLGGTSDGEVMAALGRAGEHPEGWFLPETYTYRRGTTDLDLLRQAHQAMRQALDQAWAARSEAVAVASPYEALILASIIEKETGVADERRRIAGVFSRRLGIGMRLQTDPTVIYGLGSGFDGNLRRRDLDTDTPYNTYTRAGLPPTPIALPGRAALAAAVDPAPGRELYFVALGDGSGGHQFSETYEQHQAAVRRYLARLRGGAGR